MRLTVILLFLLFDYFEKGDARLCLSCSNLTEGELCHYIVRCNSDEVCYIQKYYTTNNTATYDVGCAYPELCQKPSVRKRAQHTHVTCNACCNDSEVCNANLACKDHMTVPTQRCLSCSDVNHPSLCTVNTTCTDNEVCYLHKYITETGNHVYDVGCKHTTLCSKGYTNVFGKRYNDGRHFVCETCCSGFHCNQNLECSHHQQKSFNQSCSFSSDCLTNLACVGGICLCSSSLYFWNGNSCELRRDGNEFCVSSCNCKPTLHCSNSRCKCQASEYWNVNKCVARKTLNMSCSAIEACQETLFCIHGSCQCLGDEYWTGSNCSARLPINSLCSKSDQCQGKLLCIQKMCRGFNESSGITDVYTAYRECADIPNIVSGIYAISPNGSNVILVYCIVDSRGKWTVIQRRNARRVRFDVPWQKYKQGFGNVSNEYWLGNDNINVISTNGRHEISIVLKTGSGNVQYANYSTFKVGNEHQNYILTVTGLSGNINTQFSLEGPVEGKANGEMFSTVDVDNDHSLGNCSHSEGNNSGWWYNRCEYTNLNGNKSIFWAGIYNIVESIMMIKRI